jgi:hypothetical protein
MAVSEDLIIGIEKFRFYTNTEDTVSAEFITPLIVTAQDIQATNVLGTALVDKIITDYNADTLTGVYDTMYPMIEKMVIWQAYRYGLPQLLYRVSNGKITKGGTQDSQPIEADELANLQRDCDGKVAHYTNRLKAYLRDNATSIPEFDNTTAWYKQENLTDDTTSMGTTYSGNNRYSDF